MAKLEMARVGNESLGLDDVNLEDTQYSGLFSTFMSGTGMHGFPNIASSKSIFRKIVWTLLLFAGFGLMVYQVVELVNKYYTYPAQVDQTISMTTPTVMPSITFCNINPVKYKRFADVMPQLDSNSSHKDSTSAIIELVNTTKDKGPSDFGWGRISRDSVPPEKTKQYEFVDAFFSLNETTQSGMGYTYSDLIVECSFAGKYCTPEMFTQIFNPHYGNCYVFNVNGNEKTEQSGSASILGLSFFINQDSYVPDLTINAGIRFQIHEQSEVPLPEDFGVSLFPGSLTQIGMRKDVTYKTIPPYGKCSNFTTAETQYRNAYVHTLSQLPMLQYTQQACFKTCMQNLTIKHCNCTNPYLPTPNNTAIPLYRPPCSLNNSDTRTCMEKTAQMGARDCGPGTESGCVEQCVDTYYELKMSQSMWPSLGQMNPFLRRIMDRNWDVVQGLKDLNQGPAISEYVRNNFMRVEIYFEDLNYHVMSMSPGYEIQDLLADMGGQVGLWLGLSVLTVFEVIELFFDIGFLIFYKQQTKILKKNIDKSKEREASRMPDEQFTRRHEIELNKINSAWS